MIYFTSDTHFNHNKDFIYKARGFNSIQEHDEAVICNINDYVKENDDLFILGDIFMGTDYYYGIECIERINCRNIHIICGNHDTDNKIKLYEDCENVVDVTFAARLRYGKITFFLSHYPTMIDNYDEAKNIVNLFGHTHSSKKLYFIEDEFNVHTYTHMYNVGLDANDNCPISIDNIVTYVKLADEMYGTKENRNEED